jgi:hypothetical protein
MVIIIKEVTFLMNQQHSITISSIKYPGGLRIVECSECNYAFAAEVDTVGVIDLSTKVPINQGDLSASHSFFQTPEVQPELSITGKVRVYPPRAPWSYS